MWVSWMYMMGAIFGEIAGTICIKLSDGFTKPIPSILVLVFYGASMIWLAIAVKTIEIGVAYAVWSGVGTVVVVFIGIYFFHESLDFIKMLCIVLIIIGVVGLNLNSQAHA